MGLVLVVPAPDHLKAAVALALRTPVLITIIDPNDVTNGVAYTIGSGGAGGTGVGSVGGDTYWSTNNLNILPNTVNTGAIVGNTASIGSLPTGWVNDDQGTLVVTIIGFGTDASTGLPYIDINWSGTSSTTGPLFTFATFAPALASTQYTLSIYYAIVGGSLTNITHYAITWDDYTAGGATYIGNVAATFITAPTSTLTRYSLSGTNASNAATAEPYFYFNYDTQRSYKCHAPFCRDTNGSGGSRQLL